MSYLAEQLKSEGNKHFQSGDYKAAEKSYTDAIQKYSLNPLIFTNRANARLKLENWDGVIDDCLKAIELGKGDKEKMKAYYYLAQAQLAKHHPNEALSSALTAYDLCLRITSNSTVNCSELVIKCKCAKWEAKERAALRRRSELLAELEDKLEADMKRELWEIQERISHGELEERDGKDDIEAVRETYKKKLEDLRHVFALADPANLQRREVPDYMVDGITFEIMQDPVITKNGRSYERSTLLEHLKRSPTDPLTREPLKPDDLRPNLALKEACNEFFERNAEWAVEW